MSAIKQSERLKQFERQGFFVLERFFSADEIAAVTSNIDAKMEALKKSRPEEGTTFPRMRRTVEPVRGSSNASSSVESRIETFHH